MNNIKRCSIRPEWRDAGEAEESYIILADDGDRLTIACERLIDTWAIPPQERVTRDMIVER